MRIQGRALCAVLAALVFSASSAGSIKAQEEASVIAGTVIDEQRRPVANAKISIKDAAGKILAEVITDAKGHYCFENLSGGQYQLTLEPPGSRLQGETAVAAVGPRDISVDWFVSGSAKAIAAATPGTLSCQAFTMSPTAKAILGGVFVSGWLGSLIAAIIDASTGRRTVSSSQ